ncbi:hypothetical protein [Streptomyces litmocidini]|uniref:hypothetical protein n=1 Tax=Streptomyces litmocidini TaxID=67318 RepID=UPI001E3ED83E|nr:hypothetical protein [Streptomyces litmocidini]
MVDSVLADDLATALRQAPSPEGPHIAEQLLATLLSTRPPVLEQAPFTERAKAALRRVLRETGQADEEPDDPWGPGPTEEPDPEGDEQRPRAGDPARAVLLLAGPVRVSSAAAPRTSSASPWTS